MKTHALGIVAVAVVILLLATVAPTLLAHTMGQLSGQMSGSP